MAFQLGEDTTGDDLEEIHTAILSITASNTAVEVTENAYIAIITENPEADGYYVVKFTSSPYTLQEDIN
eukprot:6212541-Ditylum_brightwellii.AAC.1